MNLKIKNRIKNEVRRLLEKHTQSIDQDFRKISQNGKQSRKLKIMKQVIVDYIPFHITPQQINEAMKENNGKLVVKGVLQRAEAKNQNGRVYPRNILVRESKKYDENFVKQNRALGELDHPDSSVVNLQNVSHNVKEMHFEGDNLVGTVEILTTPSGNILRELFKNGIKLGISSRGLGSVEVVRESNGDTGFKSRR